MASHLPNALRIPDLDGLPHDTTPVPFPRISQRRKLVRGVGTQPWHNKGSSESDSDGDSPSQIQPRKPTVASPNPSPEIMPGTDPKRTYSESQIHSHPLTPLLTVYTAPIIRKKSGEVVKSSLKSRSPSVSSFGDSRESAPPTPTLEKFVHFDGQLERVKFFNKDHKPAAVSREGSPNESETSDNDTCGPSDAHYRSSEEERLRSNLVMEAVNIPLRNAMASTQERLGDLDIRLEQVKLSNDGRNVEGTVLVRNIAFEKWVAVRFTYDWWQTTSEVSAKYASSFPEENTDLFSFSIRLPDLTKRIEEKRLFFALRYTVAGKESWDNNRGQNYQLRFKMESRIRQSPTNSKYPPSWPVKTANVDQMADLRRELERVVREDEESSGTRSWDILTAKLRAKNMDIEEDRDAKKPLSLKQRYDFDTSSKVKWEAPRELPKYGGPPPETAAIPFPSSRPSHIKAASFSGPTLPEQLHLASWKSPRGSPRDHSSDSTASSPKFFIDPRDAKHWGGASPEPAHRSPVRTRNHQRGGYFDAWVEGASKAVLTPCTPTTPVQDDEGDAEMTASTSHDSCATVTQERIDSSSNAVAVSPSISITEESTEGSETESTSSSTESSSVAVDGTSVGLGIESRAMRFNSYPMDRSYLTAANAGTTSAGTVTSPSGAPPTLTVPGQPGWNISPQGSLSSVSSTPSFTSASSPSQCPSSPSELSDSLRAINQPGSRPTLDSVDYGYFLSKFCYYTGTGVEDRHSVGHSYGSPHHRHSVSESTTDSAWHVYERPSFVTNAPIDDAASWSEESGHTTPTRSLTPLPNGSSPGKRTPRAGSPIDLDLDSTPRISESFIRPHRGSL